MRNENGGHSLDAEKKAVSDFARRYVVRFMVSRDLSERRAIRIIRMSASKLRYQLAPDRNGVLRECIIALAHRHRCYGASMILLKLRQPVSRSIISALNASTRLLGCR